MVGVLVGGSKCAMAWCDLGVTFVARPECFQLLHLRHTSPITKLYGLLPLVITCTFT